MSNEGHSTAPGANVIVEHYCDHEGPDGSRCPKWGCYGFEESKAITLWYCREHQPSNYRGWPAHGSGQQ
jgi:hypothetical protein